jgi:hypothetical protein
MGAPTAVADLTFAALVESGPGLARLEKEVRHASRPLGRQPRVCANGVWYGRGLVGFKGELNLLVGWRRERSHADASAKVDGYAAEQRERKRKAEIGRAASLLADAAVAAKAQLTYELLGESPTAMLLILRPLVATPADVLSNDACRPVVKRRGLVGLSPRQAIRVAVGNIDSAAELFALLAEMIASRRSFDWGGPHGGGETTAEDRALWAAFGVDRTKLLKPADDGETDDEPEPALIDNRTRVERQQEAFGVTPPPVAPEAGQAAAGEGPALDDFPLDDLTAEEEARVAAKDPKSPGDERKLKAMAEWRKRQAAGDTAPMWGLWSEFAVHLSDGRMVAVLYDPGDGGVEFHGEATSETGYHLDYSRGLKGGKSPKKPLEAWAKDKADDPAREVKRAKEKDAKQKPKAPPKTGKGAR